MTSVTPETLITDTELAALVGCSSRRIRQLVESGDLERVARGKFALGPSLRALIDQAAGTGSALIRERTRATKAAADLRELELANARGEVASVAAFHAVQAHTALMIRTGMLNVPQRVVSQIVGSTDEVQIKAALRKEIVLALHNAKQTVESTTAEDILESMPNE